MLKVKPDIALAAEEIAVLKDVQTAAAVLGIGYSLIGAKAISILLHNVHGMRTYNPTMDADFAVSVADWDGFAELKRRLVSSGDFAPDPHQEQRLNYKGIYIADLVPFGGLEGPTGSISWPLDPGMQMNVRGLAEVSAAAEDVEVATGAIIRIATLPGLMALKILAWADRHNPKDAWNMADILRNYGDISTVEERIYAEGMLFKAKQYDMGRAGTAMLGRDVAAILKQPELAAVRKIVAEGLSGEKLAFQLASAIPCDPDKKLGAASEALGDFMEGLG